MKEFITDLKYFVFVSEAEQDALPRIHMDMDATIGEEQATKYYGVVANMERMFKKELDKYFRLVILCFVFCEFRRRTRTSFSNDSR